MTITQETQPVSAALAGALILIVEDQPAVSSLLEKIVRDAGGQVVGPATAIESALALIEAEPISAAVITMIADGAYCEAVAIELLRREIPFTVTTGIGTDIQHPALHAAQKITKPFQATHVQDVLQGLIGSKPNGVNRGRGV